MHTVSEKRYSIPSGIRQFLVYKVLYLAMRPGIKESKEKVLVDCVVRIQKCTIRLQQLLTWIYVFDASQIGTIIVLRKLMTILEMNQMGRYYYDPKRPTLIQSNDSCWHRFPLHCRLFEGMVPLFVCV